MSQINKTFSIDLEHTTDEWVWIEIAGIGALRILVTDDLVEVAKLPQGSEDDPVTVASFRIDDV